MAMRPGTKMTLRGEQTRDQIIQAARKLFTDRGYHSTSLYDLFDHAETTKGAFFHHWKTKEDLAMSIYERLEGFFQSNFFCILEEPGRAREKIERVINLVSQVSNGDGSYGRLFAMWCIELTEDEEQIGPAVHRLKVRWFSFWKELITRAQEAKDMRSDISAENLSFLVVSAIFGVLLMKRKGDAESQNTYEALRCAILT
ncbi:MAG TPA: TetR/AcrR family transcriptional regulator [Planctomycetota bacterium]|nr:TetR/AcrR family transcriptional regulator [Planctomycetota bacterium]